MCSSRRKLRFHGIIQRARTPSRYSIAARSLIPESVENVVKSERFLYCAEIVRSVEQLLGGRAEGSAFAQRPSRVCLRSFFAVYLLLPGSPSPTPRNLQVAGVRAGYRHRLAAVPVSVIAWSSPGSAAFSILVLLPRRARAIEISAWFR